MSVKKNCASPTKSLTARHCYLVTAKSQKGKKQLQYIIRIRFLNLISRPGFFGPALRFKPFFGFGPELVGLFTTLK